MKSNLLSFIFIAIISLVAIQVVKADEPAVNFFTLITDDTAKPDPSEKIRKPKEKKVSIKTNAEIKAEARAKANADAKAKAAAQAKRVQLKSLQAERKVIATAREKNIRQRERSDQLAQEQTDAILKARSKETAEQDALKTTLLNADTVTAPPVDTTEESPTRATADRMAYNYKEGVATLTNNVVVSDPRFTLNADRAFIFFEGTNTLSQLVVMGNVTMVNENRTAICDKAVYTKKDNILVLVGHATLSTMDEDKSVSTIKGDKITIWTVEERIEVYPKPTLTFPAKAGDALEKSF